MTIYWKFCLIAIYFIVSILILLVIEFLRRSQNSASGSGPSSLSLTFFQQCYRDLWCLFPYQ